MAPVGGIRAPRGTCFSFSCVSQMTCKQNLVRKTIQQNLMDFIVIVLTVYLSSTAVYFISAGILEYSQVAERQAI